MSVSHLWSLLWNQLIVLTSDLKNNPALSSLPVWVVIQGKQIFDDGQVLYWRTLVNAERTIEFSIPWWNNESSQQSIAAKTIKWKTNGNFVIARLGRQTSIHWSASTSGTRKQSGMLCPLRWRNKKDRNPPMNELTRPESSTWLQDP